MRLAPKNPLELSYPDAQFYDMVGQEADGASIAQYEHEMLERLQEEAEKWRLDEQMYAVHADPALWLPRKKPAEGNVSFRVVYNLPLTARFDSFGVVGVPLQQGRAALRMLCLEFEDVRLQPDGDHLPKDTKLHVPVLWVGRIACLGFGGTR